MHFSAQPELSLYLSEADVPGRMHTAARGEDGGVQDLNTFQYISHILFTHNRWPENNAGKKKRGEGGVMGGTVDWSRDTNTTVGRACRE